MDDAITDDAAGQAYVEQFGLETFERADRAVRANKVTKYAFITKILKRTRYADITSGKLQIRF
jgi:Vta1 like